MFIRTADRQQGNTQPHGGPYRRRLCCSACVSTTSSACVGTARYVADRRSYGTTGWCWERETQADLRDLEACSGVHATNGGRRIRQVHGEDNATSCQAERNFSALKLIVSDLRAKSSPGKVEKTIFLRLNKHLIYGLRKVLGDLDALKDERKSSREAPVNAKDAAAGLTNVSPILFRRNINMTSLVCGETSLGFTFFFFCYTIGLRFQSLFSPVLISRLLACVGFGVE